jgi:hypothetical protein
MPLDTKALTTWAAFKMLTGAADDDQGKVELLINWASDWFNNDVGFEVKARSFTEYHDGHGGSMLYLKNPPVASLSFYVDYARAWGADCLLTENTDYVLDADTGKIDTITVGLPSGAKTIKAVYTGGYSTVPSNVEGAVLRLARYWYDSMANAHVGVLSISIGGGTTAFVNDIPDDVKAVADQYRLTRWVA